MTKDQQDLAWACLPKEVRKEIRAEYLNAIEGSDLESFLQDFFGHHNLTSDTEPDEMLFQKRKAIMAHYSRAYQLKNDEDEKWAFAGEEIEEVLYNLFGDKCLPDKEEWKDTGSGTMSTTPPAVKLDVKPSPRFKVGDKEYGM